MAGTAHGARGTHPPRLAQQIPAVVDAGVVEAVPTDGAGAEAALVRGSYSIALRAYTQLAHDSSGAARARMLLGVARTRFAIAEYDAAADAAIEAAHAAGTGNAPADPALLRDATTLRGEALMARGKLDDAQAAFASIEADPLALRARVMLGRLLMRRGHADLAQPLFNSLIDAYNAGQTHQPPSANAAVVGERDGQGLMLVAMAARGLGSHSDANYAFQDAAHAEPHSEELQLEWGELFFEKFDAGHAAECVRDALAVNGKSPRAHALLARLALEQGFDFDKARTECDAALAVAPALTSCHVTRAGMALRDMDLAGADAHLARALATDPNDLEALSVAAAVRFLADDAPGFARAKQAVLQRNPSYSRMYSIIATFADWEHRYPEIVAMAREAVALDPDDALAHATLGLNLLRMGDEPAGLLALHDAWDLDQFDVHVYNTLNLYDDVIPQQYESIPAAPLWFRMHREERPALEPYVVPVLRGAYAEMVRRYGFTPSGPVRIEMYATDEHFSVRTSGLPNVGVQGVCFGKVVTAMSPRAGPFNWGNIVWHELAHVFHIQLSHNHVPRWFTEGLAEWETTVAHPSWPGRPAGSPAFDPLWRREDDASLYLALTSGRLPAIRDMNQAFTHAKHPEDVLVAYYASSKIVTYIIDRFGEPVLPRMLTAWGQGKRSEQVIQEVLGVSIDELDRDFRAATRQRLAGRATDFTVDIQAYDDLAAYTRAATAAPHDADALGALAVAQLTNGQLPAAEATARRAITITPGQPVARYLLAQLAEHNGDGAQVIAQTDALLAGGHDGYEVRLVRAHADLARHDAPAAARELDAATHIDADRPEAWQGLTELAHRANDEDAELAALEKLVRIDQHDRETASRCLSLLAARQRWADVVSVGELCLFADPENAESHRLLGEGYAHTGHAAEGRRETDLARRIGAVH